MSRTFSLNSVKHPFNMLAGIVGSRLWNGHKPLLVNIESTHRCNLNCVFCDKAQVDAPQMDTEDGLRLMDDLARAGTVSVCFDGGEPLTHPGIGQLIARAHKHGLRVAISTNGMLVEKRLDELADVSVLKISLDGPPEVHNKGRRSDVHKSAVNGARAALERGIPVMFRMTLNRHNTSFWPDVLDTAQELGCRALFQPAIGSLLDANAPPSPESADPAEYRDAIEGIMDAKRKGAPVGNEWVCLEHLEHWPEPTAPLCAGGRIEMCIGPDGSLYPCGRVGRLQPAPNVFELGISEAIACLQRPQSCANCWCTLTLAVCQMYALNPGLLRR